MPSYGLFGALSGGAPGFIKGMEQGDELAMRQYDLMGMQALGRAFQGIAPPQPPMPGQPSAPAAPQPPPGGGPPPGPAGGPPGASAAPPPAPGGPATFDERFGQYASATSPSGRMPAWKPDTASAPGPSGAAAPPPAMPPRPPGSATGGGLPQLDFQTLAQRIQQTNPGLPPQALVAALTRASPLLNAQGKMDLARLQAEYRKELMDVREREVGVRERRIGLDEGRYGVPGAGAPTAGAPGSAAAGQEEPSTAGQGPGAAPAIPDTPQARATRGGLSADALVSAAYRYNQTGSFPPGSTARNLEMTRQRTAIQNLAAELNKAEKIDPKDATTRQLQFKAHAAGLRVLETRASTLTLAAKESETLIPRVRDASEKVDRTEFPTLNSLILAAQRGTGGTDVIRLGTAINSLLYVYARVLKPTGVLNESDTKRAGDLLDKAWSDGQINAALDQMEVEIKSAEEGLSRAREEYGASINRPKTAPAPAAPGGAPSGGADPLGIR